MIKRAEPCCCLRRCWSEQHLNDNRGMNTPEMFFCSHIGSRLLLGSGLLFLTVTNTSISFGLLLAMLASALIRLLDGHWSTTLRLLGLLRWFVLPILLLHMLFTPGQLLFPGWPIGVSREGLVQGTWLSVHLTGIYVMAMLLFRLLEVPEWLRLLALLPRYGERLMVQALMMAPMKKHMGKLLSHLRWQFRLRHDRKKIPMLLMAAFSQTLSDASIQAKILWLRWPQQPSMLAAITDKNRVSGMHRYMFSTLWAACGCAGLLLPWFV